MVDGDRRGRELGFPTANLRVRLRARAAAARASTSAASPSRSGASGPGHPALVSVGVRPTFHDDGRVLVEVYLLDWDGDLYDATLEVELLASPARGAPLRSVESLVEQMRATRRRRVAASAADGG